MLRAIRLIKADRKYGIEFINGPWLDIDKEPEKIAARVYDIAAPALLENGTVSEEIQRQMIADASLRVKPAQPVLPEQVFDCSSNLLPASSGDCRDSPVIFPPGRARLATNPNPTGSAAPIMTIGIVVVAFLAA